MYPVCEEFRANPGAIGLVFERSAPRVAFARAAFDGRLRGVQGFCATGRLPSCLVRFLLLSGKQICAGEYAGESTCVATKRYGGLRDGGTAAVSALFTYKRRCTHTAHLHHAHRAHTHMHPADLCNDWCAWSDEVVSKEGRRAPARGSSFSACGSGGAPPSWPRQ